ncbi:hypothetical protein HDU82_007937 [Entophlyctis luteolus]|nr:hypothetical protein HDU82_007937 [Entophlyctis luteolus]
MPAVPTKPKTPVFLEENAVTSKPSTVSIFSSEANVESVENKIRAHVFAKRIRLVDLFADFDKLRSGYISAAQFRRCLGGAMERGVPLTEHEYKMIIDFYKGNTKDTADRIKWVTFTDSIDKVFGAKRLESTPTLYTPPPHEGKFNAILVVLISLPVVKPVRPPLSPKSESVLKDVMDRLRQYVKHHGSDVKSWFKDFDKYNGGYITQNQFRRGIPQNVMSQEEEDLLLGQYSDDVTGSVNYFKMNTDVNRKEKHRRLRVDNAKLVAKQTTGDHENEHVPIGTEELLHAVGSHWGEKPSSQFVENFIKKEVYKHRIRLIEFFRDYDRHNCGLVSEAQFRAGLRLSRIPLDTSQINTVIQAYQEKDGRVAYRKLCCSVEETMRLDVSDSDLHILFKKFEDGQSAKVYYMEFIKAIDPETYAPAQFEEAQQNSSSSTSIRRQLQTSSETLQALMSRIKYHVGTKRIRVSEFFRDFDKLRCYSIPRHEFIRGLNRIGLNLTPEEYEELANAYKDTAGKKGTCRWKDFNNDVETIFNDSHLESQPTKIPHLEPVESNLFSSANHLSPTEREKLDEVLAKLAVHWKTRRTSIKPFFKDFDKCLTYLQVDVSDAEFEILCKRWSNSALARSADNNDDKEDRNPLKDGADRICYLMFLSELTDMLGKLTTTESSEKHEVQEKINKEANFTKRPADLNEDEVAKLLTRIKLKAKTERIRVIDFMADFDHLKHGKITKNEFRRALKVIFIDLTENELQTLERLYQNPYDPGMVNYVQFSDAVETVFTVKGLVNAPTVEPSPFVGYENGNVDPSLNLLTVSEQKILDGAIARLREKVRQKRIDVLSYLEDFDFVREGTITTNQFRSVLGSINLPVDDSEITVLARRFTLDKNLDRLNYRAFAALISGSGDCAGESIMW